MKIVGIVESDECSGAAIVDCDFISIVKMDNYYIAASKCMFTHTPVTCEITQEDAEKLMENGVVCLDFNDPIEEVKKPPRRKRK
jgi:hypothetical protein